MRRRRLRARRAWLERYTAGECEQVWDELTALGPIVRSLDFFDDALAVAREAMRRVRRNCQILIPRLETLGWRFGYEWAGESDEAAIASAPLLLGEPTPPPILDALENRYGYIPLSLRAFYEVVGEVNFVGTPFQRAGWPGVEDGLDPLYINGAAELAGSRALLAPDPLSKYFAAVDSQLSMGLGAPAADATLDYQGEAVYVADRKLSLVRYLRYAMAGGGFLTFMPGSLWLHRPEADLRFLTHDLLLI